MQHHHGATAECAPYLAEPAVLINIADMHEFMHRKRLLRTNLGIQGKIDKEKKYGNQLFHLFKIWA